MSTINCVSPLELCLLSDTSADLSDKETSYDPQLLSMSHIDDSEALNLGNFRQALASWDAGKYKNEAIQRFENNLLQKQTELDLSSLQLKTLPAAIVRLPKLELISIANNHFTEFPSQLTTIHKLRLINISSNHLTNLGDSLKSLIKLELLNLAYNSLNTVPEYLANLESLAHLSLSGNPLDVNQLPQNLWLITKVILGRYLNQQEFMMPIPFEAFSERFAQKWSSFKEEINAECFKTWLYKLAAILLAGQVPHQRKYFFERLTSLLNAMVNNSGLRQRCFTCAEENISTCHDRILFSIFDMECKYLEEEIQQGTLSKEKIYSYIEQMYHFHRLQEKALEYLNLIHIQSGNRMLNEAESVETVLGFISSPHNTLSMPIEINTFSMFYSSVSKATEQIIQQAVKDIENDKEKNMPNIFIDYIQEKIFWRQFLYTKHKDFIDHELNVFNDRMELLDIRQDKGNEYDYLKSIQIIEQERKQVESSMYFTLTKEFFCLNSVCN